MSRISGRPGRRLRDLMYYNPVHSSVFEADPTWSVERIALGTHGFHDLCVVEPSA